MEPNSSMPSQDPDISNIRLLSEDCEKLYNQLLSKIREMYNNHLRPEIREIFNNQFQQMKHLEILENLQSQEGEILKSLQTLKDLQSLNLEIIDNKLQLKDPVIVNKLQSQDREIVNNQIPSPPNAGQNQLSLNEELPDEYLNYFRFKLTDEEIEDGLYAMTGFRPEHRTMNM